MKENVWRAKRLTREMLTYWKRYDRSNIILYRLLKQNIGTQNYTQ